MRLIASYIYLPTHLIIQTKSSLSLPSPSPFMWNHLLSAFDSIYHTVLKLGFSFKFTMFLPYFPHLSPDIIKSQQTLPFDSSCS